MIKKFSDLRLRTSPQNGLDRGNCSPTTNKAKRQRALLMALGCLTVLPAFAAGLNDTGITKCADMTSMELDCTTATNSLPNQDAFFGRDTLVAGKKGFDFIRISNNGSANTSGRLGPDPTDWACTSDNVTKLMWEVKTTSGLRNQNHIYSWYKTGISHQTKTVTSDPLIPSLGVKSGSKDEFSNGAVTSLASEGVCEVEGRCDTEKFVEDVNNAAHLCGYADWRMPTVQELQSIVDFGRIAPAIDTDFFKNTPFKTLYWSGTPHPWDKAWYVSFAVGNAYLAGFDTGKHVRLVRTIK